MAWISVKDCVPPQQKKVIAFYKNQHDEGRTVMAEYIPRWTVLAEDYYDSDVEGNTEWTEDCEQEFVAESWQELIDNWGDFGSCDISNGTVTHWMPIPEPPSGPKCPGIELGDGNYTGCSGKAGDCPVCGR